MQLSDLPLETLAEISRFLNLAQLGVLLLSGDSLLQYKLHNGGVSSLGATIKFASLNQYRFWDGNDATHKFASISLSPCFHKLKRVLYMHLDSGGIHSIKLAPTTQLMDHWGPNLVSVWLRSSNAIFAFVTDQCHAMLANLPALRQERGFQALMQACWFFEQSNPGHTLDLWRPIATMLPTVRHLSIFSALKGHATGVHQEMGLRKFAELHRLLPHSLVEFGFNGHAGQHTLLLETLPPYLEKLSFAKFVWMSPFSKLPDTRPQVIPSSLKTLKYISLRDDEILASLPVTTLTLEADLSEIVSFLPPSLTHLHVCLPLHGMYTGHMINSGVSALPKNLLTLRLEGHSNVNLSQLPPNLTHLTIKTYRPFESQLTRLPRTLTYLHLPGGTISDVNFFKFELAAALPNLVTLRIKASPAADKELINESWQLPPNMTYLECEQAKISKLDWPKTFGALTQLCLPRVTVEEQFVLQLSTNIVIFKAGTIKLQGFTAKDDTNLIELSGKTLVTQFNKWVTMQFKLFGRNIYIQEITFGEILVLPPRIQSISRKLLLSPIIDIEMLPQSMTSLNHNYNIHSTELYRLPISLKHYRGLTISCRKRDVVAALDTLSPSMGAIVLPQQLVPAIAACLDLRSTDFKIKMRFRSEMILQLPPTLTQLTLTADLDWSLRSPGFPPLLNLLKLTVSSSAVVRDIVVDMGVKFPQLQELIVIHVHTLITEGLKSLPVSMTALTILKSEEENFPSRSFHMLPRRLNMLSIQHPCTTILDSYLKALPQSITSLELNATISLESAQSIPGLRRIKCAKGIPGMTVFRKSLVKKFPESGTE